MNTEADTSEPSQGGRKWLILIVLLVALVAGGIYAAPNFTKSVGPSVQSLQYALHLKSTPAPTPSNPAADLTAELTKVRVEIIQIQGEVESETNNLIPIYNELAKRKARLTTGDPKATAAYNLDATVYTARKRALDALRQRLNDDDVQLNELLAKRGKSASSNGGGDSQGVIIYGTQTCPACKMARNYLQSKGIPYRDVDVQNSPEGAREFQNRGGQAVPMLVMNGDQVTGFSPQWVDAHLQ